MNHLFLISSAIVTKFGAFTKEQRLEQTKRTLLSVYTKCPNSKTVLIESSGVPIDTELKDFLSTVAHCFIDMSGDPNIHKIYNENVNWDYVKNLSEILCFRSAFKYLDEYNLLDGIDRVHKLSGRYYLTNGFNPQDYETYKDKIFVPTKKKTQFNHVVNIPYQYPSILWSWPTSLHSEVKQFYETATNEVVNRINQGGYADIEHLMYAHLPQEHIHESELLGVEGMLGQNGILVYA